MKVMIKNVVLFTTLFLLSLGDVFAQRLFNPIRSQSLVSAPVLLIRSGNICDLEIVNINFPDTVSVGEVVTISAYLENIGNELFDGSIRINLGFEMENETDLNELESDSVIEDQQLTNVYLNPGESLFFTEDVMIDPQKVDPNNNNVVIVWPAFRVGSGAAPETNNPNYSLVSFFTMGLALNPTGGGKMLNNEPNLRLSNIYQQDNVQFNSFFDLVQYVSRDQVVYEEANIYTIDGKILYTLNDINFSSNQFMGTKKNQNTFFIVSMRIKNPVKQQHVFVKTNSMYLVK